MYGFDFQEQIRLKKCSDELIKRDVNVIISNNDTNEIRKLYSNDDNYLILEAKVLKLIVVKVASRIKTNEVIIISKKHVSDLNIIYAPKTPIQADAIDSTITKILTDLIEEKIISMSELKKDYLKNYDDRQVDYYINALRLLDLIDVYKKLI
ncbi:hypothetical protein [Spiroplasma endosymbiont of Labia minor]|uniref:hypothetical protein n=1 Tax=Spiroplasma endosymbiont of Labia minor TaxID=3066305 RepID=UPI0030CF4F61